jgi:hypothetical protein
LTLGRKEGVHTFNVISSDVWRILLPSDWSQQEASGRGSIYFESKDGKRGAYFSTLMFAKEEHSPREELEAIRVMEQRGLYQMERRNWEIVDQWYSESPKFCVLGTDSIDRASSYRVVSQLLASKPWIARMSLHDYECLDYQKSKEEFRAILQSFQTNEEEA